MFDGNSMGEEYRDVEDAVPYRCGGQDFAVIEPCCYRGLFLRRANGVRPYRGVRGYQNVLSYFFIQFSSCERGAGSAFLCDQRLHLGLTYSR